MPARPLSLAWPRRASTSLPSEPHKEGCECPWSYVQQYSILTFATRNTAQVSGGERELRTMYLKPFNRACVESLSIMTAYSSYDGIPAIANTRAYVRIADVSLLIVILPPRFAHGHRRRPLLA